MSKLFAVLFVVAVLMFVAMPVVAEPEQVHTLYLVPDNTLLQPLMCNSGPCQLVAGASGFINVQMNSGSTLRISGSDTLLKTVECGSFVCSSVKVNVGDTVDISGSPVVYASLTNTPKWMTWATSHVYLSLIVR